MKCRHCHLEITGQMPQGFVHAEGTVKGRGRCDPDVSGQRYGLNAHPQEISCADYRTCEGTLQ